MPIRGTTHAKINKALTKAMIEDVFGRNLIIRRVTRTIDDYGQVVSQVTSDTTFIGDLQFGLDLDQRYLQTGIVEVGDGVLYIWPDALSPLPRIQDIIVDVNNGNAEWEIIDQIEAPELGGIVCHYSYRCKRRIESGDEY